MNFQPGDLVPDLVAAGQQYRDNQNRGQEIGHALLQRQGRKDLGSPAIRHHAIDKGGRQIGGGDKSHKYQQGKNVGIQVKRSDCGQCEEQDKPRCQPQK